MTLNYNQGSENNSRYPSCTRLHQFQSFLIYHITLWFFSKLFIDKIKKIRYLHFIEDVYHISKIGQYNYIRNTFVFHLAKLLIWYCFTETFPDNLNIILCHAIIHKTVFLLKNDMENYRPMPKLNFVLIIIENIRTHRITSNLERNNLSDKYQSAYRKKSFHWILMRRGWSLHWFF